MTTENRLLSNAELAVELERRRFGGVDRTWSVREFHQLLAVCMADCADGKQWDKPPPSGAE